MTDTTPGQPEEPDGPIDPFGWDYSDDWIGDIPAGQLTEAEEDYRRRAYAIVQHLTGDFGIPCFPLWHMASPGVCACSEGAACDSKGKHPQDVGWPEMASDDPERAARWWRKLEPGEERGDWRPKANVGLLMGVRHFLLDVDMGEDQQGEASLTALITVHKEDLPHSLMYKTGGGGRQHVFLLPEGIEVRPSVSDLGDDLDIRGKRSFGIAPPSESGKGLYQMLVDTKPVAPPGWLTRWLAEQQDKRNARLEALPKGDNDRPLPKNLSVRAQRYIQGALRGAAKAVSEAPNHERNVTLNREAFNLFAKYATAGLLDPGEIAVGLKEAAMACGLRGAEIPRTLRSAWEGAENKPRSGELPDWIFEEFRPRLPGLATLIYTFEKIYDLRRTDGGEFVSRPSGLEEPALVTDIGAELGYKMRWWWRTQAETWQAHIDEMIAQRAAQAAANPDKEDGKDQDEPEKHADPFPPDAVFTNAISHLRASATQHAPVELHLRVVDGPGYVAVDLGDESGSVVLITADGWEIIDVREVEGVPWFRRNSSMIPQVTAVQPEDVVATLDSARAVLDLDAGKWAVTLAGIIGAFFPSIDRPGWWLTGPSGVGKTTRARMIAGWIDPVHYLGGSLNIKRDERDARTRAMNAFIVSMDNLTAVTQDESDFWCGLHTGSASQVRKLHTDNQLLTYAYKRIGLGTSLNLPTGFKPDALRRMLHIELAGTDDHPNLESLWSEYNATKPAVLGAIFTVIAEILRHLPKAQSEELSGCPEMSDFARRLRAADLAFPKMVRATETGGEDLELYEAYRLHTVQILVDAGLENQLVLLILKLMDGKKLNEPFTCSPTVLLAELRQKAAGFDTSQPWFPGNPKQLGHRMNDLHSVLDRLGITVERGVRESRYLPYILTRVIESAAPAVTGADASIDVADSNDLVAVGDSGDTEW